MLLELSGLGHMIELNEAMLLWEKSMRERLKIVKANSQCPTALPLAKPGADT